MRKILIEHPEIHWIEETGYPSWMQESESDIDEDDIYYTKCDIEYEEKRDNLLE